MDTTSTAPTATSRTDTDAPRTEEALRRALSAVRGEEEATRIIDELHRIAGAQTALEVARQSPPGGPEIRAGVLPQEVIVAAAAQLATTEPLEGSALDEHILRAINRPAAGEGPQGETRRADRKDLFASVADLPPGMAPLAQALAARAARHPLQRALLKRLGPVQALDAALFLEINHLPHPRWLNVSMRGLTIIMKGAHAMTAGLLVAALRNPERGSRAMAQVLPALWITTAVIEVPVKHFFRRRRPFIDVVRAIVVGRRPGSFSFPSGHSAAAFAGATLLRRYYPRGTSLFYLLAVMVGFSRVYLGAHYPGDVAVGAVSGTLLAEITRAALSRPARRAAAPILALLRAIRWLAAR